MKNIFERIIRIISILLLCSCICMFFLPVIKLNASKDAKEFYKDYKSALKEADEELEDKSNIKYWQEESNLLGIKINVSSLCDDAKLLIDISKDMSFSYFDIAIIGWKIRPLADLLDDGKVVTGVKKSLKINTLKKEINALKTINPFIYSYIAILILTALVYVITIIVHLCKSRKIGLVATFLSILWGVAPFFTVQIINDGLRNYIDFDLFTYSYVGITLIILAFLSNVLWCARNAILKTETNPGQIKIKKLKEKPMERVGFCGKCGFELYSIMDFCPICGNDTNSR